MPYRATHQIFLSTFRMSLQTKLQNVTQEFQKLQADMAKAVEARERLGTQLSENELVKTVRVLYVYTLAPHE